MQSIWEMRRKAHGWFLARAGNAKWSAKLLWDHSNEGEDIALWEGFQRESGIALELILKAVICASTQKPPKNTHDVYELWRTAGLPELDDDNLYRLAMISETLHWSGRYGAPTKDENLRKWEQRSERHQSIKFIPGIQMKIIVGTPYGWKEFDRLYQFADDRYWQEIQTT